MEKIDCEFTFTISAAVRTAVKGKSSEFYVSFRSRLRLFGSKGINKTLLIYLCRNFESLCLTLMKPTGLLTEFTEVNDNGDLSHTGQV